MPDTGEYVIERTDFRDAALRAWWSAAYTGDELHACTFFQSREWNEAWWRAFGEEDPNKELLLLKGLDQNGRIAFGAPFFLQRRMAGPMIAWEHVLWLGHDLTPYPELIAPYEIACDAWRTVFGFMEREYPLAWFQLDDVFDGATLEQAHIPGSHRLSRKRGSVCLTMALDPSGPAKAVDMARPPLKRALRGTAKRCHAHGLEWRLVCGAQSGACEALRNLNLSSFGASSFFDLRPNQVFFDILSDEAADSFVHAEVMKCGIPIHELLFLRRRNSYSLFLSGMDPECRAFMPGFINFHFLIDRLLEMNAEKLDFLRGTERYKYDLGGIPRTSRHWRIVPAAATRRHAAAECLRGFKRSIRWRSGYPAGEDS